MRHIRRAVALMVIVLMSASCASGPQPGVAGIYNTWDDVVNRWIGKQKTDLYYELGPPNLHPKESSDGYTEMVWDFAIDRMPGQADEYGTLPLYGENVNCQLMFIANQDGLIVSGRRIGCD